MRGLARSVRAGQECESAGQELERAGQECEGLTGV